MRARAASVAVLSALLAGLAAPRPASAADGVGVLVDAWPGVKFDKPISVAVPKDGSDRVFVAQRTGKVMVVAKYRGGTQAVPKPSVFLDLTSLIDPALVESGQGGLLTVACDPQFQSTGRIFVFYGGGTPAAAKAVLASYRASATNPQVADPASAKILMTVPKAGPQHFGGGLAFGPDGFLYVGLGESGKANDPEGIGQDLRRVEGKILRIDVNAQNGPYGIPADNPWAKAGQGVRPEIWALGARNPWRISFDRETGALWMGDPGQKKREEIDVVKRGDNLGWAVMEGSQPLAAGADPSKYVGPVFDYGRELGNCCIGGVVYRGQRVPGLRGSYVFSDYMKGWVRALSLDGTKVTGSREIPAAADVPAEKWICSVDEDAQGELYFCSLDNDQVLTLVPAP
jgi:glucose/arabinose dehydrogenase